MGDLYESELRSALAAAGLSDVELRFFDVTDSTNTRAKLFAEARGASERAPVLFVANEQSAGRGRHGRSFVSKAGAGLFASLLFYPEGAASATGLTVYAAVAIRAAIAELTGGEAEIKWVNDVYYGGRKLAGILCEGAFLPTGGGLAYAVVGFGINVHRAEFHGELGGLAGDLESSFGVRVSRAELAARVTKKLLSGLHRLGKAELAEEYRAHSLLIGARVTVHRFDGASYEARVLDVGDGGELIVEHGGKREALSSGEVSVRKAENDRSSKSELDKA